MTTNAMTGTQKPVLYLDVDDTLIIADDRGPLRAAPHAKAFLLWSLEHFEVRWLTYWAPNGKLDAADTARLAEILDVPAEVLARIGGLDWQGERSAQNTKIDGIAWLEHLQGRPFAWIEDDDCITAWPRIMTTLREHGFRDCWIECNSSEDESSLQRAWDTLARRFSLPR